MINLASLLNGRWLKPAALLLASLLLGWMLFQLWARSHPVEVITLAPDLSCDLRAGPCETEVGQGARVAFAIEPRSIPLLQTLTLDVRVSGLPVDGVSVDLNGVDMNMGANKVTLEKNAAGDYRGTASLSVCARNAMEWQALVSVESGNRLYHVPYRFITVHKP